MTTVSAASSAPPVSRRAKGTLLRRHRWVIPVVSVVVAVLVWEALGRTGVLPVELPAPSVILPWVWGTLQTPAFWTSLGVTMYQWLVALVIATVLGVLLGLALSASRTLSKLLLVPIEFLRPIPAILLLPLVLLVFGATVEVGIGLAVFATVWITMLQTLYGMQSLPALFLDTARVYGLTRLQRFFFVMLPGVAPSIATGIRLAAIVSLVVVITNQVVGSIPGLGADLRLAQVNALYPAMYGLVIILGAIGLILNATIQYAEEKALRWHEPYRPRS